MGDIKAKIDMKIKGKKVMVFSKSYCPYCTMAKEALKKYVGSVLPADQYEVWEIENEGDCQSIQNELKKMTGASTVPRVFINGKCIGGGSETQDLDKRGELKRMLAA
ncbi:uncharacterized protein LOC127876992 [Dreissena polymorpha]|uniref:Glutaredoxin domain-containing protein n=1 Tax=Dreissena polymorpha TaxID=45954 RepID=A0A9D4KCV2_DREPO|nr:uncharacterized protein LOC127876992 [Dreissena polymorpha]KAH3837488.1 hypothetical protein DPMN_110879 [Dreissena polymorpha]